MYSKPFSNAAFVAITRSLIAGFDFFALTENPACSMSAMSDVLAFTVFLALPEASG